MKKRVVKEEKKNVRGLLSVVRLKKERKGNDLVVGMEKKKRHQHKLKKEQDRLE